MPVAEIPRQRHQDTLDRGMAVFRKITGSLDGWTFVQEKNGVKLYNRQPDNPSEPLIVRGDYHYPGAKDCTPLDFSGITCYAGCRRIWDNRFADSDYLYYRTRYSALLYTTTKPTWPVSARDFLNVTLREDHGDVMFLGTFAVEDETKPPVEGYVRGSILIGGMRCWKHEQGGLGITYIAQVNFGGMLPPPLAKSVMQQIPLCAGKMAEYHKKHGFPPNTYLHAGFLTSETFDHDKHTYTLRIHSDANASGNRSSPDAEIICCKKMYSKGVKVTIQGSAQYQIVPCQDSPNSKVLIFNMQDHIVAIIGPK
ncbi:Bet v1-like protein [Hesseltinella vesiculosa]|uniref:Bet v1-like protein n=1 Tax=Hesseltinella vesiculosa TaxID=101127 RepID=A0A1X2GVB5_9FUNG|nr:Bet v1-like protein [Hesseltinella vesiculosa]